jgi:hypothetical protein
MHYARPTLICSAGYTNEAIQKLGIFKRPMSEQRYCCSRFKSRNGRHVSIVEGTGLE